MSKYIFGYFILILSFIIINPTVEGKTTRNICHYSNSSFETLSIPPNTVNEHIQHGDTLGKCEDTTEMIIVCHQPEDIQKNPFILEISAAALQSHLDHGDNLGNCVEESPSNSISQLISALSGGILTISSGPLAGTIFTIPPEALSEDTELTISYSTSQQPSNTNILTEDFNEQLTQHLGEDLLQEFIYTEPYNALLTTFLFLNQQTYILNPSTLTFQPEGLIFTIPARITIPFSVFGEENFTEEDYYLFVHYSQIYGLETLKNIDIDFASKTISGDITHFSSLWVEGIKNFNTWKTKVTTFHKEWIDEYIDIFDTEPLIPAITTQDTFDYIKTLLRCMPIVNHLKDVAFSEVGPALFSDELILNKFGTFDIIELTTWLADLPIIPDVYGTTNYDLDQKFMVPTQVEASLLHDFILQNTPELNLASIFVESMRINKGNIFLALMTAHNTLRRKAIEGQPANTSYLIQYEKDGTLPSLFLNPNRTDRGEWYHFFGMAILGYIRGESITGFFGSWFENGIVAPNYGKFQVNNIGTEIGSLLRDMTNRELNCIPQIIPSEENYTERGPTQYEVHLFSPIDWESSKVELDTTIFTRPRDVELSPDGQHLLVSTGSAFYKTFYLVDVNGEHPYSIFDENYYVLHVDWSPDGQRMVFSGYTAEEYTTSDLFIGTYDPLSKSIYNIINITQTYEIHHESYPSWSPDGKTIIYENKIQAPGHALRLDLYTFDVETGIHTNITNVDDVNPRYYSPRFSPDGLKFSYIMTDNFVNSLLIRNMNNVESTILYYYDAPNSPEPADFTDTLFWSYDNKEGIALGGTNENILVNGYYYSTTTPKLRMINTETKEVITLRTWQTYCPYCP